MKKMMSLLLAVILVLSLCACGNAGDGNEKQTESTASTEEKAQYQGLQVGFGRENIIPDQNFVEIAGGDAKGRLSDGYLDEVATTCIAIREGEETILLYTVDLITVSSEVYAAQSYVSGATDIAVENIIMNATHTHSGVSIRSKWDGIDAYIQKFNDACVAAAEAALEDLAPAQMYFGSTMTESMVFVRHYLMNDGTTYGNGHGSTESGFKEHLYPADEELQVIKFAREDKKDVVLMNLGAHATINNALAPTTISADWPYNARTYVEENTDSLCAVFEAAAGDQIPNSKIAGIAPYGNKYPDFGNKVGEYCVSVLSGEMSKAEGTGINLKIHNYKAPTMKEGTEDVMRVMKAKELVTLAGQMGGYSQPEVTAKVKEYGFNYYLEASGLASRANYPDTYSMDLHLLTVNGVSFIFAPFEMFGVTGREIKDNSPYDMTFVITCSENRGGHMGYLPHEYGCEQGFYEYDVTKFARGTAEDLAVTYVDLLTEMKNGG